jgi:leucyl-tRNA synthetase
MRVHNSKNLLDRRRELRKSPTRAEEILWEELKDGKLGTRFRRQHSIGGYILDFYCFKARLIIELDGNLHDKEYDAVRDKFFQDLGYKTLRFKNFEIENNLEDTLNKIKTILDARKTKTPR